MLKESHAILVPEEEETLSSSWNILLLHHYSVSIVITELLLSF